MNCSFALAQWLGIAEALRTSGSHQANMDAATDAPVTTTGNAETSVSRAVSTERTTNGVESQASPADYDGFVATKVRLITKKTTSGSDMPATPSPPPRANSPTSSPVPVKPSESASNGPLKVHCASGCNRPPILDPSNSGHECEACSRPIHVFCVHAPGGNLGGEEYEGYGAGGYCKGCSLKTSYEDIYRHSPRGLHFVLQHPGAMEPEQKVFCEADDWTEVWSEDWSDPELPNWINFNPSWLGREQFWFNPANAATGSSVRDDGSQEHFASLRTLVQQPASEDHFYDHKRDTLKFGTAFLRSQLQFRYGRLEAEVQPSSSAVASAFWLVRDEFRNTQGYQPLKHDHELKLSRWEVDVFELSTAVVEDVKGRPVDHAKRFHTNFHYFCRHPDQCGKHQNHAYGRHYDLSKDPLGIGLNRSDDRFKVAFEWTKDYIQWEVNGTVLRRACFRDFGEGRCDKDNIPYCHEAMWIQFDMEILFNWFGVPSDEEVTATKPAEFKIYRLSLLQKGGEGMYYVYHPFNLDGPQTEQCRIQPPTPVPHPDDCEA